MDLGYRCSLLYKALFEQDEEKEKQTKEEFERAAEFRRADELFEHAKIRYYAGRTMVTAIFVRCPRCGRIGKLRKCGKTFSGNKYVIRHRRHSRYSESVCHFGVYNEHWEYLDEIYQKYKTDEDINPDFYKYEGLTEDFKKWLRGVKKLSKYSVRTIVTAVRTVLRRYGLVDESDLENYLRDTPLKTATKNNYCRSIRYFLEFLRSSHHSFREVKKGKEEVVGNEVG